MLATALVLMQLGSSAAVTWVAQPVGTPNAFHIVRALDPYNAWAAGANGTFARTIDGGLSWYVNTIYSCTACPVSGLVVHDANSAVLTSGARPARIYLTGDSGRTWNLRYESDARESRLGALAFFDAHRGLAVGDPMVGHFLLLATTDGGATWVEAAKDAMPAPRPGERLSDVSGNAATVAAGRRALVAVSGGAGGARVFRSDDGGKSWTAAVTHLAEIHGLAFSDERTGVAVGSGRGKTNFVRTTDGGATWTEPVVAGLAGPKEGIAIVPGFAGRKMIAVGPTGSVASTDGGATWQVMDRDPAHAISIAGSTDAGWKVGDEGSVRKLLRGVVAQRRAGDAPPIATQMDGGPALGHIAPAATAPPGATPTPLGGHLKKPAAN